jgi:TonB family protein
MLLSAVIVFLETTGAEPSAVKNVKRALPVVENQIQQGSHFREWELAGGELILRIHASVIDGITPAIAREFNRPNPQPSAGVLLGAVGSGRPVIVRIESYEPALSPAIPGAWRERLGVLIAAWSDERRPGGRLRAVGYFRTAEQTPGLDPADFELLQEAGAPAVGILIHQPTAEGLAATIALRVDEGDGGRLFPAVIPVGSGGSVRAAPQTALNPASQITAASHPLAEAPHPPATAPERPARPLRHRSRVGRWALLAAAMVLTTGIGAVWGWKYRSLQPPASQQSSGVKPQAGTLGLQVERVPGGLTVRWDKTSRAMQVAGAAVLTIVEGGRRIESYLDEQDLTAARVYYATAGDDVRFSLQLFDRDQNSWTESAHWVRSGDIRAGSSEPQPVDAGDRQPIPDVTASIRPPAGTPDAQPRQGMASRAEIPRALVPAKPFRDPATQQAAAPAPDLPSPPTIQSSAAIDAADQPVRISIPRPATVTMPAPAAPQQRAPLVPQTVSQPVPIERPLPVWQKGLLGLLHGPVEIVVNVEVDAGGRVTNAVAVQTSAGAANLAAIAVNTARQWRFTPAKVGGHPVPSKCEIRFVVKPPPTRR